MTHTAPILYTLTLEGQIYMAKALGDELKRPVVGVATTQRIMEMMTEERREYFEKVYSLPDFYLEQIEGIRALSLADLNREQFALEKELHVKSTPLYTSYDRNIREMDDLRTVKNWQLCNLRFVKMIFDETNPAFVLSGIALYFQHVIHDLCVERNIPYLRASANRSGGTVMYHADGQFVGMETTFNKLQKDGASAIDKNICDAADALFNNFVDNPAPPKYSVLGSTLGLNVGLLIKKIRWTLRPEHLFPSAKVKLVDRALNMENGPFKVMKSALRTGFYRTDMKLNKVLEEDPDMSVPFLYLPLHYAPEVSDMYFGSDYDHHEGYITQLSKHIPSDCVLYVKEHICMSGRRPTSFYKNLSKLHNVKMIAPQVKSFDLIEYAKANIMVTGTAGWEAYLLGKPVVCFGDVFYNFLPGVLHCDVNHELADKIRKYLKGFELPKQERQNAYRAYYACSFDIPFVDIGETLTRNKAAEAAQKYAACLNKLIQKWHKEIPGKFPSGLIEAPSKSKKKIN